MADRRSVHVVINPASGADEPVLARLNDVFRDAGVRWQVSITQDDGDARRQAREAADAGADVVAAYGGDGTVSEVAAGLRGGDVPLAILPGGTGNAVAQELGIPLDLEQAARLAASPDAIAGAMDVLAVGERVGILRVGAGIDAAAMAGATRELKDQLGWLAYPVAGLRELGVTEPAPWRLELDGRRLETVAHAVLVVNVGRMGRGGARFPGPVDPFDGRADVFVLRRVDLPALVSVCANLVAGARDAELPNGEDDPLWHLQARDVSIETPAGALPVHVDGDPRGETPLRVETQPGALRVLLPPEPPA